MGQKMLDKRRARLIKAFIKNPNVKNAVEVVRHHKINLGLNRLMCEILGDGGRPCDGCLWDPICQLFTSPSDDGIADKEISGVVLLKMGEVTDEILSEMVLDAIRALAIHEAENA